MLKGLSVWSAIAFSGYCGVMGFVMGRATIRQDNLVVPFNNSARFLVETHGISKRGLETMCAEKVNDLLRVHTGSLNSDLSP